ncbi:hypothetical protein [Dermatobacter hominis]|uniref:hypothetical protein n=1 Tax=Dermatobacter hominis TaxID=2884263 RepID=UPI001D1280EA|nr:hypothetical protein [Dermatobacter hominis]UDY36176.1 hypothetical protein LH044_01250 [Dermatobacter hominis]
MSALDLVVVLLGVVALGATVAMVLVSVRMHRATQEVERSVRELDDVRERFEAEAAAALEELHLTVLRAGHQVDEVEALVDVANAIGERVDTATGATYRALTSPVIKTVALASGTRRAARRLRPGHDDR